MMNRNECKPVLQGRLDWTGLNGHFNLPFKYKNPIKCFFSISNLKYSIAGVIFRILIQNFTWNCSRSAVETLSCIKRKLLLSFQDYFLQLSCQIKAKRLAKTQKLLPANKKITTFRILSVVFLFFFFGYFWQCKHCNSVFVNYIFWWLEI